MDKDDDDDDDVCVCVCVCVTDTMECYSAIKKNEIIPFSVT